MKMRKKKLGKIINRFLKVEAYTITKRKEKVEGLIRLIFNVWNVINLVTLQVNVEKRKLCRKLKRMQGLFRKMKKYSI